MATVLRASSLAAVPWKNGGGITRELAAEPEGASMDTFAWRLSIADVSADGAFSSFAGVDRVLILLDGAGMTLAEPDYVHTLNEPLAMARFAGETPIHAALVQGPTRDFNVMTRRGRAHASVTSRFESHEWTPDHDVTFLHCARGMLNVMLAHGERIALAAGDSLRIESADGRVACEASQDASWLQIGIHTP
ncbi:HutD/Ves family protein [Caballeronia sp. HLA56]